MLFLVQVPLKQDRRRQPKPPPMMMPFDVNEMAPPSPAAPDVDFGSDVEQAVLGHGRNRGPFSQGNGLRLQRDDRFPIRITVQFYKATSNGIVSERDLDKVSATIGDVYEHADFVGSLVMPDGDKNRPTAWQHVPRQWFSW